VQVARGLSHAHKRGLIHRDIKPDNILVASDGQAKLTDLGLAKDLSGGLDLTRTGRGLGTPHFTAPEQIRDAKHADVPGDIYSLAATLYQMVTGEVPFKTCGTVVALKKKTLNDLPPARAVVPELSVRIESAIRRAMAAVPAKRPQSCKEFVQDLLGQKAVDLEETPAAADAHIAESPTLVAPAAGDDVRPTAIADTQPSVAPQPEPTAAPAPSPGPRKWVLVGIAVVALAVAALLALWTRG